MTSPLSFMIIFATALIALSTPFAVAHVPPAPTTPSSPAPPTTPATPTTPSSPAPPTTPTPPTTPETSTTPSSPSPPTGILPPKGIPVIEPPCCADEAIKGVPGCKEQIKTTYTVITEGSVKMGQASVMVGGKYVKIGSACCEIVNAIGDICWQMMYPKCPIAVFFRGVCSIFGKVGGGDAKPLLSKPSMCLGALRKVPGCMRQINDTVTIATMAMIQGAKSHHVMHENVEEMGSSCCKVIDGISDPCWQEMYPKHPQFPQVVKGICSVVDRSARSKLFDRANRKIGDKDRGVGSIGSATIKPAA